MNKRFLIFVAVFSILIVHNAISQGLYDDGVGSLDGHIPDDYQVEWTLAGLLVNPPNVPDFVWDVTELGAVDNINIDSYFAVAAAICSARAYNDEGYSAIYFPAGNYRIETPISLSPIDSNVIFLGDGYDDTRLHFVLDQDSYKCFQISGNDGTEKDVTDDIDKDSKSLESSGLAAVVSEGDWINFYEKDHPE